MNYRSTNTTGHVHFGGAVVAGVEQGSGIELNGASSGSSPVIAPVGDEDNKSLIIKGKGTGGVQIGSSGSVMTETLTAVVHFTPPTLSTGANSVALSTHTVTGVSSGTVLHFQPANAINNLYTLRAHCSTVNELKLIWGNHGKSTLGSGESSNHGRLVQFRF